MRIVLILVVIRIIFSADTIAQTTESLGKEFLEVFQAGDYQKALPIAIKAYQQCLKEFGDVEATCAICSENVGATYTQLQQHKSSLVWYHRAVSIYRDFMQSEEVVDIHLCYNLMAGIHTELKNFDSANIYYEKAYLYFLSYPQDQYENLLVVAENYMDHLFRINAYPLVLQVVDSVLPVIREIEGESSEAFYRFLVNKAGAYRNMMENATAMQYYLQAQPLAVALYGTVAAEYVDLLQLQADCLRKMGQFPATKKLLDEAAAIVSKMKDVDPMVSVRMHQGFANYFGEVAMFPESFLHFDSALTIMKIAGFEIDLQYGVLLKDKAYTYLDAAQYIEAGSALAMASDWFEKAYGNANPYRAELLISQANMHYFLHRYQQAGDDIQKALREMKATGDTLSYLMARCYEIQAMVAMGEGHYESAIQLNRQSIDHSNRVFGDSNYYAANTLSNLGIVYQEMGEFAKAEEVLRESFAIKWKIFGNSNHPQLAIGLANWGMVMAMQGRYKDADQLLAGSVEIMKANNMLGTSNGQNIINNVALLALKQGDDASAEMLFRQVMASAQAATPKNEGAYTFATGNLSTLLLNREQNDSSLYYALQTMEGAKKVYGNTSHVYLKAASNASVAYSRLGRVQEGRQLMQATLPLIAKTMGDSSELMSMALGNLASIELQAGNTLQAAKFQQQALDIQMHHYKMNLFALSERDQVAWWTKRSSMFQLQPAILATMKFDHWELTEKLINQQLQLKGFVLTNARGAIKRIRAIQNPKLQETIGQWEFLKKLYLSEAAKPLGERKYSIDSLQYLANVYEQAINAAAGNLLKNSKEITWQEVQKNLGEGQVALEYISYPLLDNGRFKYDMQYAAIVITPTGRPSIVPLGSEKAIRWCMAGGNAEGREMQVNRIYRTKIGSLPKAVFWGDSLYKLVWQPLESYLRGATVVHLAPEGILHKLAFPALTLPGDSVLLDRHEIRQYASVRQVQSGDDQKVNIRNAFLAGHADFKGGVAAAPEVPWSDLPGTKEEMEKIDAFFTANGKQVKKVAGMQATESAIRTLTGASPDIIHIATHGFFLPAQEAHNAADAMVASEAGFLSSFDDPLLRSGIVLTGANLYWDGEKQTDAANDGILTAYELTQQNWENTKLVTLSACETGLGDVQDGEGVFGLKRAIKLAGAQYTLVSLWQVPDAETAELMSTFYENLLAGLSVPTAFHRAQSTMRKKYKPYEWAAFVLSQ